LTQLGEQFGEGAAPCFMNAFDILYRKFIRKTLKATAKEKENKMTELAHLVSEKLFVTGGALYNSLLKTETRSKSVKVESVVKGRRLEKVEVQKYSAKIKPNIIDGPKTPFESSIYSKVNSALSKLDSRAKDYDLGSSEYDSPNEWESNHKEWIENTYSRTSIPSGLLSRRKQLLRSHLMAKKKETPAGQGSTGQTQSQPQKISPEEWKTAEASMVEVNQEKFDAESIKSINDMLGSSFSKEELINLAEDDIVDVLCK